MRPLKLRLANFTCFPRRCGSVDFPASNSSPSLVRPGAGKSSLLDAIIFALYGAVPRMRRPALPNDFSRSRSDVGRLRFSRRRDELPRDAP